MEIKEKMWFFRLIIWVFPVLFIFPSFFNGGMLDYNNLQGVFYSASVLIIGIILLFYKRKFSRMDNYSALYFILFVILVVVYLVSSFINNSLVLAFDSVVRIFLLLSFLIVCTKLLDFQYLSETEEKTDSQNFVLINVAYSILFTLAVISVLGFLQIFRIDTFITPSLTKYGSTFGTKNFAAEYFVAALPYALVVLLLVNKQKKMLFFIPIYILIYTYLFSLRTRTAYLVIAIQLFLFVFFIFKKHKSEFFIPFGKIILLIGIIAISFLINFSLPDFQEKKRADVVETVKSVSDIQYASNITRFYYYKSSVEIFKMFPVFGCGTNGWSGINPLFNGDQIADVRDDISADINPHNDFLKVVSENGIVGFLIYVSIFISFFAIKKKWSNPFTSAAFLSMVGITLSSFLAFPGQNIPLMIIFILNISVVVSQNGKRSESKSKFVFAIVFVLAIISLTYYSYKYYSEKVYLEAMHLKAESKYDLSLQKLNNISKFVYAEDPNKMPIDYYKGVAYFMMKDYESSLKCFEAALKLEAYNPLVLGNKAASLFALSKFAECEKLLLDMRIIFPYYFEPQINLLALYANLKQDVNVKNLLKEFEWIDVAWFKPKNIDVFNKIKKDFNEKN